MDIHLYDFESDFESVKKKINKMKTNRRNKELLLDFAEDCLTGWQVRKISLSRTTTLLQRLSRMTVVLKKEWMKFEENDTRKMLQWIDKTYPSPSVIGANMATG